MGYRGETFKIDLDKGGFSFDQNIDKLAAEMMVEGTRNINLHKGGRSKRGGTDNVNDPAITGTPRIHGLIQFRTQAGNAFIVTAGDDGKIYADYTTEIGSGFTINRAVSMVVFNNLLLIATGNDQVQVWTGTGSVSVLSNPPTDWVAGNFPRKLVTHGREASERLWAMVGKTSPQIIYGSLVSAGDASTEPDFKDATVLTFQIDTGDGFGIVNGVEFGERLIVFGKKQSYILIDTSTTTGEWFFKKTQFKGGTATDRTLVVLDNDIISMDEFGTIYSVVATQDFGDYKMATLTRKSFIDEFIRDKVRMLSIDDFHMEYDPVLRLIYVFVARQGQTTVDTALCYFIDRGPEEGWIIKDNQNSDSGYKASVSALVREDVGDYKIYTGGWEDGFVWELETTTFNDNDAAYSAGFKTPRSPLGDPRSDKLFHRGWILTAAKGDYNLSVNVWIDGVFVGTKLVSLSGTGDTYGAAAYTSAGAFDAGVYGGVEIIEVSFEIGKAGKRIETQVFNNNVDEDFFVSQIMYDFRPLGRRAA